MWGEDHHRASTEGDGGSAPEVVRSLTDETARFSEGRLRIVWASRGLSVLNGGASAAPATDAPAQPRDVLANGIRRVCDCLVAASALAVLSPLLLLAALAIRIDSPGPVLFRQRRLGLNGRPFTVYKLRTMVENTNRAAHREYVVRLIKGDDEARATADGALFKASMEDYITRPGRWLRSFSIDEFPQLWNVLTGDMSLVGPRPVIPYEAALFPDQWRQRFAVKPGMTGLWQVSGRNQLTYAEMIDLDLEYVRRRSLRLDASILLRTIPAVALRRGVS